MLKQLDRVLVAIDFSDESIAAARWVASEITPGAELVLLYVVDVPRPPVFLAHITPDPTEIEANARRKAEKRLGEIAASLPTERVRSEVRSGRPADAIRALIKELAVDLVVLGPHDQQRGFGRAIGATADLVLRHGTVPVLVAKRPRARPPTTILLPIDASRHSAAAARWAAAMADRTGARVVGIHAVDPALYGRMRTVGAVLKADTLRKRVLDATEKWIRQRLTEAGVKDPVARAVLGEPRAEILAAVDREDADLVVMGSRGSGGVGRAVLGSLARTVAREASCPLLLVTDRGRPESDGEDEREEREGE